MDKNKLYIFIIPIRRGVLISKKRAFYQTESWLFKSNKFRSFFGCLAREGNTLVTKWFAYHHDNDYYSGDMLKQMSLELSGFVNVAISALMQMRFGDILWWFIYQYMYKFIKYIQMSPEEYYFYFNVFATQCWWSFVAWVRYVISDMYAAEIVHISSIVILSEFWNAFYI